MENYYALVEIVFSGALIMGICIWQLVSVRREIARDRETAAQDAKQRAQAE